jgi:hypothetical protein
MNILKQLRDKFHLQMAENYSYLSLQRGTDGEYEDRTTRLLWIGFLLGASAVLK